MRSRMLGFAWIRTFGEWLHLLVVCGGSLLSPKFRHAWLQPNSNQYNAATIGRVTRYTCRSSDGFRSVDQASRQILVGETKQQAFRF